MKPPPHLLPDRCRQCSSTLLPGAYRSGPEEGTFVCAEHCARLGPGGRSGTRPGPPLQPKQQQLGEEVKDVDGGGPGRTAPAGAEAEGSQASPEARPQITTKPRLPNKPQELGGSPAGRPTPAPRRAPESPAPTPPTPRPRSSLQHENLAEQGGSSGLVNGEQGPSAAGHWLGCVWCLHVHVHCEYPGVHVLCLVWFHTHGGLSWAPETDLFRPICAFELLCQSHGSVGGGQWRQAQT